MPVISTLSSAIHTYFNLQTSLVGLLTGGLWTGEVPEGTQPPYGWLDLPDSRSVPNTEDQFEDARVVFHLFALGAANAEALADSWKAAYDYQSLTFPAPSNVSCVMLQPLSRKLVCEMTRYKQSQLVYRASLSYRILTQRPR